MKWCVYMLLCNDNSIYTGITNDLNKRFRTHISGKGAKYFRGRKPIDVVYTEFFINRSMATKREIEIKKLNRKKKEILINKQS
jgi:putative endonuclease